MAVDSKKLIVGYGLLMAVLIAAIKFLEYRYMLRDITTELYIGLIAALFTSLGIWMGIKWNRKNSEGNLQPNIKTDPEVWKQYGISAREYDVLTLICEGYSNQEIADKLFISIHTVKTHSSNLYMKLGVKRRTQAIQKSKELELIQT
jgi:two-component system, NarL family, response regulator LiaR